MKKDTPKIRIPPPLFFLFCLGGAWLLEYGFAIIKIESFRFLRWTAALLIFSFAGYLALHAVIILKLAGTHIDPGQPTTKIVDKGPFRISRNPMYLSLVLVLLGLSTWFVSIWFLVAAAILLLILDRKAVNPEEIYLQNKFGDKYNSYRSRVRRWL